MNIAKLTHTFCLTLCLAVLISFAGVVVVSAQTPPDTTPETVDPQLPAGIDPDTVEPEGEGEEEPVVTNDSDKSKQDFLTGVGVGAVAGIIVGGVVVWFVKKRQ